MKFFLVGLLSVALSHPYEHPHEHFMAEVNYLVNSIITEANLKLIRNFQPHEVKLEKFGKNICHYLHFEMSFESGNLHVCGYETTDGTGVLSLMGLSQHALKWDACNASG